MAEPESLRITVMTEDEAYRIYARYADDLPPARAVPFYTFAGWLKHKGIRIVEEKQL